MVISMKRKDISEREMSKTIILIYIIKCLCIQTSGIKGLIIPRKTVFTFRNRFDDFL